MIQKKFLEAYDKYAAEIFYYCYGRVLESRKAENLVKEIYCQAWSRIVSEWTHKSMKPDFTVGENIRTLLYRVADPVIESKKHIFYFDLFFQNKKL